MKENKDALQKNPTQIFYEKLCDPEYLNRNLERAIQNSFAKGVPVVQADEKGTYELYPDGTKKYITDSDKDQLFIKLSLKTAYFCCFNARLCVR